MFLKGKVKRFPETNLPISNAVGETAEIDLTMEELVAQIDPIDKYLLASRLLIRK
jgi:hypothetical protein